MIAHAPGYLGVLATLEERVRFARRRFGHYDVIDFLVVLLGYAISGERTLEAFYESLRPFAVLFMALGWRENAFPIARRSPAFSQPLSKLPSRHCAQYFSKTCSLGLWRSRKKREGCGTGKEGVGWCSMWMARWPGCPPTRFAIYPRSATGTTPVGRGLCFRLHGAQAGRDGQNSDDRAPGSHASMGWHLCGDSGSWQRRLPR